MAVKTPKFDYSDVKSVSYTHLDGSFYIEAAHIKPKSQQGTETPDNILILCPNHHKEFDLGKREIIEPVSYTHLIKGLVKVLSDQGSICWQVGN